MITTGNQKYQRALNMAHVMRLIRAEAPISRAEISDRLGLTRSTVTSIVTELRAARFVTEIATEAPPESGGRPAVPLDLSPDVAPILGVDLRPDRIAAVVVNLHGVILASAEVALLPPEQFSDAWVFQAIRAVLRQFDVDELLGVGIGITAAVDPLNGRLIQSNLFGAAECDIVGTTARELAVPILAENDANCVAWGERQDATRPAGAPPETVLCLHLARDEGTTSNAVHGFGVGLGMVVDGSMHYGRGFAAGEIRTSQWTRDDRLQVSANPADFSDQAEFDRVAFTEVLRDLGVLSSVLRPDRIRYSGDLLGAHDLIDSILDNELAGAYISPNVSECSVEPATYGAHAVSAGAARMFIQQLFSVPGVDSRRPVGLPSWGRLCASRQGLA
jgi:DNA-binding Lrp family transcriptional regulator